MQHNFVRDRLRKARVADKGLDTLRRVDYRDPPGFPFEVWQQNRLVAIETMRVEATARGMIFLKQRPRGA
jgi:hypothetical protein